jgi:hypothetical protein
MMRLRPSPMMLGLAGLCIAAMPAGAANGVEAILKATSWGERSSQLAQAFGERARTLARPIEFGDSYVDVVLRNQALGGYPFTVYFQMDPASRGLKRIQFERQRHGANPRVFRAVLAALRGELGPPTRSCSIPARSSGADQAEIDHFWISDSTVVRAVFRDTTLEASEGCLFDDESTGACGLTGQLFVQISPAGSGAVSDC